MTSYQWHLSLYNDKKFSPISWFLIWFRKPGMSHDAISFPQDKAEEGRGLLQISFDSTLEVILPLCSYRSLNAIVAQSKNCPFVVNTTIELKNTETTPHKNGIWRGMFRLRRVPVLLDLAVELHHSIKPRMAIFGSCHCCIQWAKLHSYFMCSFVIAFLACLATSLFNYRLAIGLFSRKLDYAAEDFWTSEHV